MKNIVEKINIHFPVIFKILPASVVFIILYIIIETTSVSVSSNNSQSILSIASLLKQLLQFKIITSIFLTAGLFFFYKWNEYLILVYNASSEKKNVGDEQTILFKEWENKWAVSNGEPSYSVFLTIYKASYNLTKSKRESNRHGNFFWKGTFILTLITALAMFMWIITTHKEESVFVMLIDRGVFLIVLSLGAGIVAKWLDIKRYQETWSRHSRTLHRMNMEMLAFVEEFPPYQRYNNPRRRFMERILVIWDDNQAKFSENMEGKEMELMDAVSRLSPLKDKKKE